MTDHNPASDHLKPQQAAASGQKPSIVTASPEHASEEERVRHERFHQAVRQFLSTGSLEDVVKPISRAGGSCAKLLSEQELKFLLR
jgi:hypothetical protein